jgi:membrane-associated phospholipid phosphatase
MNSGMSTSIESQAQVVRGDRMLNTSSTAFRAVRILASIGREHSLLMTIALAYISVSAFALFALSRPRMFELTNVWFLIAWTVLTLAWIFLQWVHGPRRVASALDPVRVGGALLVVSVVVPFQSSYQALKQAMGPVVGFPLDTVLARIDETLHGGPAWRLLSGLFRFPEAIRWIDRLYMAWFPALLLIVVWLSWTSRRALRARALIALILTWIVGGTAAAWALASAGPCYSQAVAYRELVARLDGLGIPLWARSNQHAIWDALATHQWLFFGGVSAMPSMHVALAVWMAIVLWHRSRLLGVLMTIYALAVQLGSIVLAWHYAVDGYAGAAVAWACWHAATRLVPPSGEDYKRMNEAKTLKIARRTPFSLS